MIHKMILDERIYCEQKGYEYGAEFLREYDGYDLIHCGDYHYPFLYLVSDPSGLFLARLNPRATSSNGIISSGELIHE